MEQDKVGHNMKKYNCKASVKTCCILIFDMTCLLSNCYTAHTVNTNIVGHGSLVRFSNKW